jgi:hypothetical protein
MRYHSWLTNLVLVAVFTLLVLSCSHVQAGDTGQHYVPFNVVITEVGICNTAGVPSSNPRILIDSAAESGTFMVTSILIQPWGTTGTGVLLSVNAAIIDGTWLTLLTRDFAGGVSPVNRGFDIMGVPLRTGRRDEPLKLGGNFPHTIAANSAGDNDIEIRLFCRSDNSDVTIRRIVVAGWKQASDIISVKYIPGE